MTPNHSLPGDLIWLTEFLLLRYILLIERCIIRVPTVPGDLSGIGVCGWECCTVVRPSCVCKISPCKEREEAGYLNMYHPI